MNKRNKKKDPRPQNYFPPFSTSLKFFAVIQLCSPLIVSCPYLIYYEAYQIQISYLANHHHRLRFPSLLGHCACSTGGFHLEPLVLLRGPLVPSSFPTLYCISRPLTPNWVPLSATIRVRYSPLLTPISDWVNPPLHEYCNFTCVVSYHLDFHQLDLGSFTGPFPCRHPAGI